MPRPPRLHIQHRPLMEFCNRVCQGFGLLLPDPELNLLIVGALAKSQEQFPMPIHGGQILGGHFHLLGSPADVRQQAGFMALFTRRLSLIVGRRHAWQGSIFPSRYRATEISIEEKAQAARLKYVLGNGCKEGLVASPLDWPGVPFAESLVTGRPLQGIWIDHEALYAARRRGQTVSERDFTRSIELRLTPLPCWAHLSRHGQQHAVRELVRAIEKETASMHQVDRTLPAGPKRVVAADPWIKRPLQAVPCPWVYARSREMAVLLREGLKVKVAAYRKAAERLRSGDRTVQFPPNCFPPSLPFEPHKTDLPTSTVPGTPQKKKPKIRDGD